MTTREKTSKLLAEFKGELKRIYGDRLKGVFLFGSQARGEATSQSDVDIIVVLDDWNRYLLELKRTGAIASELSLASGMSISRVFVRERDWLAKVTPFLANARAEAIGRVSRPKLSWEETAKAMATAKEDWSDWDSTAADGLDRL